MYATLYTCTYTMKPKSIHTFMQHKLNDYFLSAYKTKHKPFIDAQNIIRIICINVNDVSSETQM